MSSAASRVVGLILAAVLLAGCTFVEPAIKIGLVAPFEGRHRAIGYDAIYSARLAVRELNAAGGINGRPVALVALDDNGDQRLARQAAATLGTDPDVIAVVGHFLPHTSESAAVLYSEAGLPTIDMSQDPFNTYDPDQLPESFRQAYAAVTPFDETAGPYAGPTYDAFQLLWKALALAEESGRETSRGTVRDTLNALEYDGLTGRIFQP